MKGLGNRRAWCRSAGMSSRETRVRPGAWMRVSGTFEALGAPSDEESAGPG